MHFAGTLVLPTTQYNISWCMSRTTGATRASELMGSIVCNCAPGGQGTQGTRSAGAAFPHELKYLICKGTSFASCWFAYVCVCREQVLAGTGRQQCGLRKLPPQLRLLASPLLQWRWMRGWRDVSGACSIAWAKATCIKLLLTSLTWPTRRDAAVFWMQSPLSCFRLELPGPVWQQPAFKCTMRFCSVTMFATHAPAFARVLGLCSTVRSTHGRPDVGYVQQTM